MQESGTRSSCHRTVSGAALFVIECSIDVGEPQLSSTVAQQYSGSAIQWISSTVDQQYSRSDLELDGLKWFCNWFIELGFKALRHNPKRHTLQHHHIL